MLITWKHLLGMPMPGPPCRQLTQRSSRRPNPAASRSPADWRVQGPCDWGRKSCSSSRWFPTKRSEQRLNEEVQRKEKQNRRPPILQPRCISWRLHKTRICMSFIFTFCLFQPRHVISTFWFSRGRGFATSLFFISSTQPLHCEFNFLWTE